MFFNPKKLVVFSAMSYVCRLHVAPTISSSLLSTILWLQDSRRTGILFFRTLDISRKHEQDRTVGEIFSLLRNKKRTRTAGQVGIWIFHISCNIKSIRTAGQIYFCFHYLLAVQQDRIFQTLGNINHTAGQDFRNIQKTLTWQDSRTDCFVFQV